MSSGSPRTSFSPRSADKALRLETERLGLRLPRRDDADAATELVGDPEVMRFLGGETVPREDVPAVVAKWIRRWELSDVGPFVLERREDRALPEIGWALVQAHWGDGFATEAARAVRDWARAERGFEHLISLIAPDNLRSRRVAERLGARPTGTVSLFDTDTAVVWVHA